LKITPDRRFERLMRGIYLSLQREWIVLGTHQQPAATPTYLFF
jgi:hypothetical protein